MLSFFKAHFLYVGCIEILPSDFFLHPIGSFFQYRVAEKVVGLYFNADSIRYNVSVYSF